MKTPVTDSSHEISLVPPPTFMRQG